MRKIMLRAAALTVCLALLSGCGFHFSAMDYDHAKEYTMGGATLSQPVERVEIEWISGSICLAAHSDSTVDFSEQANRKLNEKTTLYYWLEGTTLHIKFGRAGRWDAANLEKDLTVYLPEGLALKDVEIDSVSADVTVDNVAVDTLELDTVSGDISAWCPGTVELMEVDAVSGDVSLTADRVRRLEVDNVSGDTEVTVSDPVNVTVEMDTVSGKPVTDLPYQQGGDEETYIFGTGEDRWRVDNVSGKLKIG